VQLPATIDANIVKALEQLKALAARHPSLTLDLTATRAIDLVGAELLLRVINAFKRASHELTLLGAEHLLNPLRAAVEPGRRDTSDAAWMLLLELLRMLNRQDDFEETAIQYCITFEVSPPQWEPAPLNIKLHAAPARTVGSPAPVEEVAASDTLTWHGVIEGEGEPWFGRMLAEARTHKHLSVDCRQVRRMAFSAASTLLTHAMKLQQAGIVLELRDVNYLIGALFHLLGLSAVARVQLRRI
jgi:anti-anti-sigma regulatory factor